MLSVQDTARRFLVTPQTIYNWLDELRQDPQPQRSDRPSSLFPRCVASPMPCAASSAT